MKTIRTFTNVAEAGFASSLLESVGIRTLLNGQESFMMLPGPATGGIQLQVAEEDFLRAEQILEDGLYGSAGEATSEGDVAMELEQQIEPSRTPTMSEGAEASAGDGQIPVAVFLLGAAALGVLCFAVWQATKDSRERRTQGSAERQDIDYNSDGKPDHVYYFRNGVAERGERDRNFDGRADAWETYNRQGWPVSAVEDANFDGKPDRWFFYRSGQTERTEVDVDFDGVPDVFGTMEHGQLLREDVRPANSKIVVRRYVYRDNLLREELVDENRDGKFDYRILLDPFGNSSDRLPADEEK